MNRTTLLIGHSCSGKSTLMKSLIESEGLANWQFLDLDTEISKRHGDISAIFKEKGEEHFRELEVSVFAEVLQESGDKFIALGAGFPLEKLHFSDYKTIHLVASPTESVNRVIQNGRPMSTVYSPAELLQIFENRDGMYLRAEHQFDPAKISPEDRIKYLEKLLL